MRSKLYVGLIAGQKSVIFRSKKTPTRDTHGDKYNAVIGPFRTKPGAVFMRDFGPGNPHCRWVADAEKLARIKKDKWNTTTQKFDL